jgi:transcriptional regulator with XRE-family HTH domain
MVTHVAPGPATVGPTAVGPANIGPANIGPTNIGPINIGPANIGRGLRAWRERRRLSQMELALRAEVSTRHLSFVETGRAQPGRDLVLRLADELDIPLRERNTLLAAAGFAPVFERRGFDDAAFDPVRGIIDMTLERHKPFPAYVIDRYWTVVRSNAAVPELYDGVDPALMVRPVNAVRLLLHPKGMAPRIENFGVWWSHMIGEMRRHLDLTGDPKLEQLLREALSYATRPAGENAAVWTGGPAIPLVVRTRLGRLSFIGATTVFGSPVDVTLDEIALELMHPADAVTDQAVQQAVMAAAASAR